MTSKGITIQEILPWCFSHYSEIVIKFQIYITLDNIHTTKNDKRAYIYKYILYISCIIKSNRNFSTLSNAAKTQPKCQVIERGKARRFRVQAKKHQLLIFSLFPLFFWNLASSESHAAASRYFDINTNINNQINTTVQYAHEYEMNTDTKTKISTNIDFDNRSIPRSNTNIKINATVPILRSTPTLIPINMHMCMEWRNSIITHYFKVFFL